MAGTFSRDGRDFYKGPDGQLVSVESGFDVSTAYQGLAPATEDDVKARDYEKQQAKANVNVDPAYNRDAAGNINPDAAFGETPAPAADEVGEFVALEPTKPAAPTAFSKDGRDYYVDPAGQLHSVEAGFDAASQYPGLKPATEEQVHKREIQQRSGHLIDQVETVGHTALATVAETGAGLYNFGHDMVDFYGPDSKVTGKDIVPGVYGKKELEQREANPAAAFIGAAVPDLALNYLIPGGGAEGTVLRGLQLIGPETTAARVIASSLVNEAGNAVIDGEEYDMGRALSVWAPMQIVLEGGGNVALHGLAKSLGWSRNVIDNLVARAQRSAAADALREVDPVKQASKLLKNADTIYESAQATVDEALGSIDDRLQSAPDRLFTRSALKRSVSSNIDAQSDAIVDLATQLAHAAEVTGAPTLEKAAKALDGVRGSNGATLYDALRQVRLTFDEARTAEGWAGYAIDNPLVQETLQKIDATLTDENVWGRAAKNYSDALGEAARSVGPVERRSVRDLGTRDALEKRLEQARAMAALTGDTKLGAAVEKAAAALKDADKVTGARVMSVGATTEEIKALRKSLDAFPERAPQLAATINGLTDKLDELSPDILPDTWTIARIEGHVAARAAGSKAARLELDQALDHGEQWIAAAKRSGSESASTLTRADATISKIRDALAEVDDIHKAFKTVRDFDAKPRNFTERAIDAVVGKTATKVASRLAASAGGALAGYAGGGAAGAAVGGLAGHALEDYIEPIVRARATKFGQWLKESLRKHGKTWAGVAALYEANRLATDPNDPSPNAAATVGLLGAPLVAGAFKSKGLRRLEGYKSFGDIVRSLGRELSDTESEHLSLLLKDAQVPTRLGTTMDRLYDASKIAVTHDGKPIVFNKKGYAQSTARYEYQAADAAETANKPPKEPRKIGDYTDGEEHRKRIDSVTREEGFGKPAHRGLDTIEVNEKGLTALARKTGEAIRELEPEEQVALLDYIEGGGASTFRGIQRGEAPLAGKERYAASLPAFESAIEQLQRPGLTEKIGPLWRGFHVTPEAATQLVNAKVVETGALTSTSFRPFYAKDMFADTAAAQELGHVPVVLKFEHVERAAPISAAGFSKQYGSMEREAILPTGSRFEVVDATRSTWAYGGHIELTLREIPKGAKEAAKVGFVLTGLLGLGSATLDDDDQPGTAAAAVVGLSFLLGGKLKLRSGDMPSRAEGLLRVVLGSLEHHIPPGMAADAIEKKVDRVYEGWAHSFTHNIGREPNVREAANVRDLMNRTAAEHAAAPAEKAAVGGAFDVHGSRLSDKEDERLLGAINKGVEEMVEAGRENMSVEALHTYTTSWLGKDFTPAESDRLRTLIKDHFEDISNSAGAMRARMPARPPADPVATMLREGTEAMTGHGSNLPTQSAVHGGQANGWIKASQNYLFENIHPHTTPQQLAGRVADAMTDFRNAFEDNLGRRLTNDESEYVRGILKVSAASHFQSVSARVVESEGRLAAERLSPLEQRRAALTQGSPDELFSAAHDLAAGLPDDERRWLASIYDEPHIGRDIAQDFVVNGHRESPDDVVRQQLAGIRNARVGYVAEQRGVRRPTPMTAAYTEMGRLSPQMEAAARAELAARNTRWAAEAQKPPPAPSAYEARQKRLAARATFGRELMRDVSAEEADDIGRFFKHNELGQNPAVEDVDRVVDRVRKERRLSPSEEVWLRDQLNQRGEDWGDTIREAAEWNGSHFEGTADNRLPRLTADDVIHRIESGELGIGHVDLSPWDEWHIREQFGSGDSYQEAYNDAVSKAVNERSSYSEPPDSAGNYHEQQHEGFSPERAGLPSGPKMNNAGIENIFISHSEGVRNVFGRNLTIEDMKQLFALDELSDYAGSSSQSLDTNLHVRENSVVFRGEVGDDMHIERHYTPRADGRGFDVHNSYLILPDSLQDEGVGKKILNGMADAQERLGAREMELSAAWIGKYIWAKLGFRPARAAEEAAKNSFKWALNRMTRDDGALANQLLGAIDTIRDLADTRLPLSEVEDHLPQLRSEYEMWKQTDRRRIRNISFEKALIKRGKDGAPDQFLAGKHFLLTQGGSWNGGLSLKIKPGTPWYDEYRARIGAGAIFLGFGLHELLDALNESPMSYYTEKSPREQDEEQAERVLSAAHEAADAKNEAREQQLDETRDKLGFLSHQGKQLVKSAARALARPQPDPDRTVERVPGVTASAGVARFLGTHSTLAEAFEDKRRLLETIQRDPVALIEHLSDGYSELQDTAPELHSQVTAQTFKVAQFLQSKMPATIGKSLVRPDGKPPNDLALRQFALYYSAATDPSSVITDLANNRARREQVETLKQVWEPTYTDLKLAVLEEMASSRPTVNQRLRLDLLFDFGDALDTGLSSRLMALAGEAQAKAAAQEGPGGGGGGGGGGGAPGKVPGRRTQPSTQAASATASLTQGAASGLA